MMRTACSGIHGEPTPWPIIGTAAHFGFFAMAEIMSGKPSGAWFGLKKSSK